MFIFILGGVTAFCNSDYFDSMNAEIYSKPFVKGTECLHAIRAANREVETWSDFYHG